MVSRPSPLANTPLPSAAIISAPARVLIQDWVDLAKSTIGPDAEIETIHARSYGRKDKDELLRTVLSTLESASLFATTRLVIVFDGRALINEKPIKAWIKSPTPGVTLLVTHMRKDARDSLPAWKGVSIERVEDPGPGDGRARTSWLQKRAEARGCRLLAEAIPVLEEQIGSQLDRLDEAVEKLCLYRFEGDITREDVEALIGRSAGRDFDRLWEAVAQGNFARAMELFEQVSEEGLQMFDGGRIHGREPVAGTFLPLMMSRLRRGIALATAGKAQEALQKTWGMHPFYAKKLIQESKRLGGDRRTQWLRAALAAEVLQKRVGGTPNGDLLELLFAEMGARR